MLNKTCKGMLSNVTPSFKSARIPTVLFPLDYGLLQEILQWKLPLHVYAHLEKVFRIPNSSSWLGYFVVGFHDIFNLKSSLTTFRTTFVTVLFT
jgi:hypothetical protein